MPVNNFYGYTYPGFMSNRLCQKIWRIMFCRRGWHLWDEYIGYSLHYLFCDSCGERVLLDDRPIVVRF